MRLIIAIMTIFLFVSCESEIAYDHSDFQKSIVVNSILSTDSPFAVNLHWSKSIFDNSEFQQIDSARVLMQNLTNGKIYVFKQNEQGFYDSPIAPQEGFSYGLIADIPGFDRVRAETHIPKNLDAQVKVNAVYTDDNFDGFEIELEIEDDPNEENYYIYEVVKKTIKCHDTAPHNGGDEETDPGDSEVEDTEVEDQIIDYADVATLEGYSNATEFTSKSLNETSFVSDKDIDFSGNKFKTSISLTREEIEKDNDNKGIDTILNGNEECEEDHVQYAVKVMTVSSDLFEFLKSVDLSNQQQRPNTSATTPVKIESNIINGLGIFGGINVQIFPIE